MVDQMGVEAEAVDMDLVDGEEGEELAAAAGWVRVADWDVLHQVGAAARTVG